MTLRIGFVGAGGIAATHLRNMSEHGQVKIAAVCDIVEAQAAKAAQTYDAAPYTDAGHMLERETLDALFICVPPFAHGDLEERAAAKGIHLFVEKPVGLDMDTVRKKAAAIRESGVLAGTGYCLRYLDTVRQAQEYLQDKTVSMVRAHYLTSFVTAPWWKVMSKSGGQFVEQATHTVDLVRYLAGDVKQVYANMALRDMTDIEGLDIPDVGSVNLIFESGAVGHVDTTFLQPDHRMGAEFLGRGFRVAFDGTALLITDANGTTRTESGVDFYKEQDKAFVEALLTGDRTHILAPYEEAVKTLEITLAATVSSDKNVPVRLPL